MADTEEILAHLETLARVGAKRKVAEAKLRAAVEIVAEKVAVLVGEACALPGGYTILNADPDSHMTGAPPRAKYLVLVSHRSSDGNTYSSALSPVPKDAYERFDFPPAGRLALSKFAEAVQNGWLFKIAELVDQKADRIAENLKAVEQAARALS